MYVPERREILVALFSRWGEIDPKAALDYACAFKDDFNLVAVGAVTKSWAGHNLAAARENVEKMPGSMIQKAAVAGLMEKLSETDPKQAFELAQKTETYSNVIRTCFENWSESNPEEAAVHAAKFPPGFQREAALEIVAETWAQSDLQSALHWAEAFSAKKQPNRLSTDSPLPNVLDTWLDADSESALRWLEAFPAGEQKSEVVSTLIRYIRADDCDLPLAERLIAMAPSDRAREQAWGSYVGSWCDSDLDGAVIWAQKQPAALQETVLPKLAENMAQTDPSRALELVSTLSDAAREKATNSVLKSWANIDATAATLWLQKQPPQASLYESVAQAWVAQDLAAATQWVNALEDGPMKDEVVNRVVSRFQNRNPQVALAWIEGISDDAKRVAAYRKLARSWIRNDRIAARSWIESAPLPEPVKSELLKPDTK
jgi:hypothetical protein